MRLSPQPVPRHACLTHPGHHVWGGSTVRGDDGRYHMYVSMWPESSGHEGWCTHSVIAHAVADDALGPFSITGIALGGAGGDAWDRDVTHNPTVHRGADGRYYLYYMGNRGDGQYWTHRNQQQIGVAVADDPTGPWQRFETPVMPRGDAYWNTLMTSNPSVCTMPDGRTLMIYKASGSQGDGPMYGPVRHGVAIADSPLGPFERRAEPIFESADPSAKFPGEDPYLFRHGERYYTILKDMGRFYGDSERSLVLFVSDDGIDWRLHPNRVITTRSITWDDGEVQEMARLERPQLLITDRVSAVLYLAAKPAYDSDHSYNLHLPLYLEG